MKYIYIYIYDPIYIFQDDLLSLRKIFHNFFYCSILEKIKF